MKHAIVCLLLLIGHNTLGQQTPVQPLPPRHYYLEKSNNQQRTGRILLASGACLLTTAFVVPRGKLVREGIFCGPGSGILCSERHKNDGLKSAFLIAGGAAALGSIPFFVVAKKHTKAATISLHAEQMIVAQGLYALNSYFPTVHLQVPL